MHRGFFVVVLNQKVFLKILRINELLSFNVLNPLAFFLMLKATVSSCYITNFNMCYTFMTVAWIQFVIFLLRVFCIFAQEWIELFYYFTLVL